MIYPNHKKKISSNAPQYRFDEISENTSHNRPAQFEYGGVFFPYFAAIGCCRTATIRGQS